MNLDLPETYEKLDRASMRRLLRRFPHLCREGWRVGRESKLPESHRRVKRAVVAGMGASAIAGEMLSVFLAGQGEMPIAVWRDYGLPPSLSADTLVIASSYSGETEETLSVLAAALERGLPTIVLTGGGKLRDAAAAAGVPIVPIDVKAQPRSTLGYSLCALVGLLQTAGLVSDQTAAMTEAIDELLREVNDLDENALAAENPAKELARELQGKIPIIYGGGILAPVARRWKTQFNENSKAWAFFEELPEAGHNAVVGFNFPPGSDERVYVVMLYSPLLPEHTRRRLAIIAEFLDRTGVEHKTVSARGKSAVVQQLTATLYGDYVSYYLALLYETDPSPVANIDYLKQRLTGQEPQR
ncbi:MAG: bifunctional phosphoglucose/phosphomannose isomerase [Dehalococcoidia bacterium]|nr:bifunctional phosphoglucose/phosphomannose isomerase [Dehalococcoidia bacterium]